MSGWVYVCGLWCDRDGAMGLCQDDDATDRVWVCVCVCGMGGAMCMYVAMSCVSVRCYV